MKNTIDDQVGGNHYTEMAIGPTEYCQANKFNAFESAAIKHISRHGRKGGKEGGLQDLLKAIHEIQMVIDLEYSTGLPNGTLNELNKYIPDNEKANELFSAIQRGNIPNVVWSK